MAGRGATPVALEPESSQASQHRPDPVPAPPRSRCLFRSTPLLSSSSRLPVLLLAEVLLFPVRQRVVLSLRPCGSPSRGCAGRRHLRCRRGLAWSGWSFSCRLRGSGRERGGGSSGGRGARSTSRTRWRCQSSGRRRAPSARAIDSAAARAHLSLALVAGAPFIPAPAHASDRPRSGRGAFRAPGSSSGKEQGMPIGLVRVATLDGLVRDIQLHLSAGCTCWDAAMSRSRSCMCFSCFSFFAMIGSLVLPSWIWYPCGSEATNRFGGCGSTTE